jgi:hypothetical protein
MPLAYYRVVDPARLDPEFFGLVRSGIIFLDPRPEPDTAFLTKQLSTVFFFLCKKSIKKGFLQILEVFKIKSQFYTWTRIQQHKGMRSGSAALLY